MIFRTFLIVPFIQRYADDPELLWAIGKRLKVALAIRFARSDSVGAAREFIRIAKKEQEIAKACNRPRNSIIYWNTRILPDSSNERQMPNPMKIFDATVLPVRQPHGAMSEWRENTISPRKS